MARARVLDFGTTTDFGNLAFSDLAKHLEERLTSIRSLPDLEKLIKLMNPFLTDERFSSDEKIVLKRLRQRAYDRKRNPKFQMPISRSKSPDELCKATKSTVPTSHCNEEIRLIMSSSNVEKEVIKNQKSETFSQGIVRALTTIDGEYFIRRAPSIIAWLIASTAVAYFLWQQSLALYETAGFANARHAATGGVLMIVGFAAYHSISRSWLALLFCLYAGAYEGYLMVSGTIHDDNQTAATAAQSNPDVVFLKEKAEKERSRYHELKHRYEDPESKVFHNDWFMKTHLNPAWETSAKAHEEYATKKATIDDGLRNKSITWLKIFYRLGLVFLCMLLVHQFFAAVRILCTWEESRPPQQNQHHSVGNEETR